MREDDIVLVAWALSQVSQIYVDINVQYSCKILQSYLKALMSYRQEIVWGYFLLARPVAYSVTSLMRSYKRGTLEESITIFLGSTL